MESNRTYKPTEDSVIRDRCDIKDEEVTKIEKGMLEYFGHMEKKEVSSITIQIYKTPITVTVD